MASQVNLPKNLREELASILLKLFQKIAEDGTILNLFHGDSINLTGKSEKDIIKKRKENCRNSLGIQLSSVTQSCPTLCDTVDYRTPGFPVHHQ